MPHSSGGGSSGGGSHSGGGHHSSSGHVPRSILHHTYHKEKDHVFVHYTDGRGTPSYIYSEDPYWTARNGHVLGGIFIMFWAVLFCLIGIVLFITMITPNERVTSGIADPCQIDDSAGCFSSKEEENITKAAEKYYDRSGIPIIIHTITKDMYDTSGESSLENYAYRDYKERIHDENHWLIVFEDTDRNRKRWDFEGMQGDNTDIWLSESVTSKFNDRLVDELRDSRNSYGEAFASSINWLAKRADSRFDPIMFLISLGATAMGLLFGRGALSEFKGHRKELAGYHEVFLPEECRETGPQLVICSQCGKVYVLGERRCPFCGAPGKKSTDT